MLQLISLGNEFIDAETQAQVRVLELASVAQDFATEVQNLLRVL
jgi:hypothetical protein